jgi:hypothetical protein
MAKPISFDVEHVIAEVASRHRLLLKPDDAAFALVTMNRLVLEESLEAIHSRVLEDLALFQTAAQKAQNRAEAVLAAEVRDSAAGIRGELGEISRTHASRHRKSFNRSMTRTRSRCPTRCSHW